MSKKTPEYKQGKIAKFLAGRSAHKINRRLAWHGAQPLSDQERPIATAQWEREVGSQAATTIGIVFGVVTLTIGAYAMITEGPAGNAWAGFFVSAYIIILLVLLACAMKKSRSGSVVAAILERRAAKDAEQKAPAAAPPAPPTCSKRWLHIRCC